MDTQTQRAYKLWSWWLPNAHDDRVKCYSRSQGTNVKIIWNVLLQSLWYDVSCTAKEPPVPSPYTVKETLRTIIVVYILYN